MADLDRERFLFDTQGYLVVEDVLSPSETAALNRIIDERAAPEPDPETGLGKIPGGGAGAEGAGFLEWGAQFCDLLDHARIMPVLRLLLGNGFRIDHFWGGSMNKGAQALRLHGGIVPFGQTDYYFSRGGRLFNGLTNVAWNLVDSGGAHGGFMVMPGSHKSSFAIPQDMVEEEEKAFGVAVPEARAGSVSIFTEAALHGAAGWKAGHQRRTLFFSYTPSHMAYSRKQAVPPTEVKLTKRQRLLFEPPSAPHSFNRPTLFEEEYVP